MEDRGTVIPIANLQLPNTQSATNRTTSSLSATSVCFLDSNLTASPLRGSDLDGSFPIGSTINHDDTTKADTDASDDTDDENEMDFRCRSSLFNAHRPMVNQKSPSLRKSERILSDGTYWLVSCHASGETYLWNLRDRRPVGALTTNRGQGTTLRRLGSSIIYQTRDEQGTVSIHSFDHTQSGTIRQQFETHCRTFCAIAPCEGDDSHSLLATPVLDDKHFEVRDLRSSKAIVRLSSNFDSPLEKRTNIRRGPNGMLSSLSMCLVNGRPIVSSGWENGCITFHDILSTNQCTSKMANDPVLAMDLAPSQATADDLHNGVVCAVGLAGDTADLLGIQDEGERGTFAIVKATCTDTGGIERPRIRSRVGTCSLKAGGGKPGVSNVRFRPDGRIIAVSGWDKRIRLFDRSAIHQAAPQLMILKGHEASAQALDWADDSSSSGLLASGDSHGKICVWRCFAQ